MYVNKSHQVWIKVTKYKYNSFSVKHLSFKIAYLASSIIHVDFAVGAPYDGPDESGAVYIYHGRRKGLAIVHTQVCIRCWQRCRGVCVCVCVLFVCFCFFVFFRTNASYVSSFTCASSYTRNCIYFSIKWCTPLLVNYWKEVTLGWRPNYCTHACPSVCEKVTQVKKTHTHKIPEWKKSHKTHIYTHINDTKAI